MPKKAKDNETVKKEEITDDGLEEDTGSTRKWSLVKRILPFLRKKIAVLVDGPNILRKEFNIKLEEITEAVNKLGKIQVSRVYLNQFASEKLVEAISNSGYEPIITNIDVHLKMAMDSIEILNKLDIKYIAIVSRHARCLPIILKLKEKDLETIAIGFEPGFSVALQNTADYVFKLK